MTIIQTVLIESWLYTYIYIYIFGYFKMNENLKYWMFPHQSFSTMFKMFFLNHYLYHCVNKFTKKWPCSHVAVHNRSIKSRAEAQRYWTGQIYIYTNTTKFLPSGDYHSNISFLSFWVVANFTRFLNKFPGANNWRLLFKKGIF